MSVNQAPPVELDGPNSSQATVEVHFGPISFHDGLRECFHISLWAETPDEAVTEVLLHFDTASEIKTFAQRHNLTLTWDEDAADAAREHEDPEDAD